MHKLARAALISSPMMCYPLLLALAAASAAHAANPRPASQLRHRPLLGAPHQLIEAPTTQHAKCGSLLCLRGGGEYSLQKQVLAELFGTFVLLIAVRTSPKMSPWATKPTNFFVLTTLGCLIYFFGDMSGCNINPAVNVAQLMTGEMSLKKFALYTAVQVVGAAAATKLVSMF